MACTSVLSVNHKNSTYAVLSGITSGYTCDSTISTNSTVYSIMSTNTGIIALSCIIMHSHVIAHISVTTVK